jgi:hypothetical protein
MVQDTGNGCIDAMDVSNVTVRDNICRNAGQEAQYASFAAGVQLVTLPGSAPQRGILIEGNMVNGTGIGIAFDGMAGAPTYSDVLVTRNNTAGGTFRQPFKCAPNVKGSNFVVSGNTGF